MNRALPACLLLALLTVGTGAASEEAPDRPPLIRKQGRFFAWAQPKDWREGESMNGVNLESPDAERNAAFCVLFRSPGRSTPEAFARRVSMMLRVADFQLTRTNRIDGQPPGMVTSEVEFTFRDLVRGPRRGGAVVSIVQNMGQYDAYWQWYSTVPEKWESDRLWLPVIARSVQVTNPYELAGNNTILQPRNNPLDNSALIKSWEARSLSQDRISQATREGIMGYERVQSPTSGRYYEMPLETYNGARGGYLNPENPGEVLIKPDKSAVK